MLYAQDRYALLLVFQAMDAAGKDSTIRTVMSGVNPAGCQVFSFKRPTPEELDLRWPRVLHFLARGVGSARMVVTATSGRRACTPALDKPGTAPRAPSCRPGARGG